MTRLTRPPAVAPVAAHASLASADAPWAAWPWDAVPAQFAAVWFDQLAAVQASWLQAMVAMPARLPFPLGWPAAATPADGTDTGANDAIVRLLDLGQWAVESATACWLNACKPAHTDEIVA